MQIVSITSSEYDAIYDIYTKARSSNITNTKSDLTFLQFQQDIKGESIFVSKINSQIVGYISLWEPDNFVHHLYIMPQFQNNGIGNKLLEWCKKKYGLPLSLKCEEANYLAQRFYEINGWRVEDKGVGGDGPYLLYVLRNR